MKVEGTGVIRTERYERRRSSRRAVDPAGIGAAGGAFAGTTSAEVLKLLLGAILIAAALKAFWRHQ